MYINIYQRETDFKYLLRLGNGKICIQIERSELRVALSGAQY